MEGNQMPRAGRLVIPGQILHLTHRCHKKEWLLKFAKDRKRWLYWLWQARKRYGLTVLNYVVTSNHIHLLVEDGGTGEVARSMQLVQSRTAQEFNRRKERHGAFWEDRYHCTAVESDGHLHRCMSYIDMNMVRAGVVSHPKNWSWGGFAEIQNPRERMGRIDYEALFVLLGVKSLEELQHSCLEAVDELIQQQSLAREVKWSSAIAVGSEDYVTRIKADLKPLSPASDISEEDNIFVLREQPSPLYRVFGFRKAI